MMLLPVDIQADFIETFDSTSRYLDDVLNVENPDFEGMVSQIKLTLLIPRPRF